MFIENEILKYKVLFGKKNPVSFCWLETSWLVSVSVSEMPRDGYRIRNISMSIGRPGQVEEFSNYSTS